MSKKVRVLIVDDSAVVRQTLEKIFSLDHEIEVIATASDPYIAAEKIRHEVPDVITLDVEMPRMDGITFLQKLMSQHPIPVVICSGLTDAGSDTALKALEYGAVDIILKPRIGTKVFLEESKVRICDAVKAAAMAKVKRISEFPRTPVPKLSADVILKKANSNAMMKTTEKVVVVGASTGGTEALSSFLQAMPLEPS
jgi:two-component system chemotaxis response regulator CheB